MWSRLFMIVGDGESTTLSIDLEESPVGMEFRGGHKPAVAFMRSSSGPVQHIATADGTVTFTFSRPPAHHERVDVEVEFYYAG